MHCPLTLLVVAQADSPPVAEVGMLLSPLGELPNHRKQLKEEKSNFLLVWSQRQHAVVMCVCIYVCAHAQTHLQL